MVSTSGHSFCGTYDGDGKTLSVNISNVNSPIGIINECGEMKIEILEK